jgi:uncharacterized membrane protein YcaP (DUF421 family)
MKKHLRQELITEEELLSQLRQQGVQNLAEVKRSKEMLLGRRWPF